MKSAISKDQAMEIRRWLEKQRVPKETVDSLLSSQNASNTYKSYRMKKQINTPDGWSIHFGANWARPLEKGTNGEQKPAAAPSKPSTKPTAKAETTDKAAAAKASTKAKPTEDGGPKTSSQKIKAIGGDLLSRTFMGLAEKLKQLQIEDVDKPLMQKIAVEIDKDHLGILKKMAGEKNTTVGNLIRVAVRDFIEHDH